MGTWKARPRRNRAYSRHRENDIAGNADRAPRLCAAVDLPPDFVAVADPPEDVAPIQVEHNARVTTSLTICLVESLGARYLLGVVAPVPTKMFVIGAPTAPGPYRLIAEGAPGQAIASRPIHLRSAMAGGRRW
jgi:hypothetical protein